MVGIAIRKGQNYFLKQICFIGKIHDNHVHVSGEVEEPIAHKNGSEIYNTADKQQTDRQAYLNDLAGAGSGLTFPASLPGSLLFL